MTPSAPETYSSSTRSHSAASRASLWVGTLLSRGHSRLADQAAT